MTDYSGLEPSDVEPTVAPIQSPAKRFQVGLVRPEEWRWKITLQGHWLEVEFGVWRACVMF